MKNKKYQETKKNGGVIPPLTDKRVLYVTIQCGKCMQCKKQKSRAWQARLLEEIKAGGYIDWKTDKLVKNEKGKMVTLTFSNESITKLSKDIEKGLKGYERDNAIATLAIRRFMERWRKKNKVSVRHWLVTELGHKGTENIHLHGILFTNKSREEVLKTWNYGFMYPRTDEQWEENYVSERTANYIIKYITKTDLDHKYYNSKVLCSAGIGNSYSDNGKHKYIEGKTNEAYTTKTGHKIALPIYWRNKLWDDDTKEKLWIDKLNKDIRYVGGKEYRMPEDITKWGMAIKTEQKKSIRLGYLTDRTDWTEKEYEITLRNINWLKRVREMWEPKQSEALH